MRVLSVRQPFAQLIVRGALDAVTRSASTPHRGVVAIHASSAPITKPFLSEIARAVAPELLSAQGWQTVQDMAALPLSSVVGVVRLTDVSALPDWAIESDEEEDEEEDEGEDEEDFDNDAHEEVATVFEWQFGDAVEIVPVTGVRGQVRLWTLPEDVAALVTAAESAARPKKDPARFAALEPETAAALLAEEEAAAAADAAFWARQRKRERDARRIAKGIDARVAKAEARRQLEQRTPRAFWHRSTEEHVARAITLYLKTHEVRGSVERAKVRIDRRQPYLRELFHGREWVPVTEFKCAVRDLVRSETSLPMLRLGEAAHEPAPYEEFSASDEMEDLTTIFIGDDGTMGDAGYSVVDKPRRHVKPAKPEKPEKPEKPASPPGGRAPQPRPRRDPPE